MQTFQRVYNIIVSLCYLSAHYFLKLFAYKEHTNDQYAAYLTLLDYNNGVHLIDYNSYKTNLTFEDPFVQKLLASATYDSVKERFTNAYELQFIIRRRICELMSWNNLHHSITTLQYIDSLLDCCEVIADCPQCITVDIYKWLAEQIKCVNSIEFTSGINKKLIKYIDGYFNNTIVHRACCNLTEFHYLKIINNVSADYKVQVVELENHVTTLEEQVVELENHVVKLEEQVTTLEDQVAALKEQVVTLSVSKQK